MKAKNKKYLDSYKKYLYTAWKHNYSYNFSRAILQEFEKIYTEETGITLQVNYSCSSCVLSLLSKVGKLYFTKNPNKTVD